MFFFQGVGFGKGQILFSKGVGYDFHFFNNENQANTFRHIVQPGRGTPGPLKWDPLISKTGTPKSGTP